MRSLLTVLALLLAVPATAVASDATLERSWARYQTAGERLNTAVDVDESEDGSLPVRELRRVLRKGLRLVRSAERRIAADTPTSLTGGAAQEAALLHLRATRDFSRRFLRLLPVLQKSIRLEKQGRRKEARRLVKRNREDLRAFGVATFTALREERRAKKLFKAIAEA